MKDVEEARRPFPIANPFGAPSYRIERTGSTMDEGKTLAAEGASSGTVIMADFQEKGRGRVRGRQWVSTPGESLLCTALLRFDSLAAMPEALPLRVGLAAARAIEELSPDLATRVQVKWPNDVVIQGRKLCGVLCEGDGRVAYIGTGFNITQRTFPQDLAHKASSLLLETLRAKGLDGGEEIPALCNDSRGRLLEAYLCQLKAILEDASDQWLGDLNGRLFRRGERVRFEAGIADSREVVDGVLAGVGTQGELILQVDGEERRYVTGELLVYASS